MRASTFFAVDAMHMAGAHRHFGVDANVAHPQARRRRASTARCDPPPPSMRAPFPPAPPITDRVEARHRRASTAVCGASMRRCAVRRRCGRAGRAHRRSPASMRAPFPASPAHARPLLMHALDAHRRRLGACRCECQDSSAHICIDAHDGIVAEARSMRKCNITLPGPTGSHPPHPAPATLSPPCRVPGPHFTACNRHRARRHDDLLEGAPRDKASVAPLAPASSSPPRHAPARRILHPPPTPRAPPTSPPRGQSSARGPVGVAGAGIAMPARRRDDPFSAPLSPAATTTTTATTTAQPAFQTHSPSRKSLAAKIMASLAGLPGVEQTVASARLSPHSPHPPPPATPANHPLSRRALRGGPRTRHAHGEGTTVPLRSPACAETYRKIRPRPSRTRRGTLERDENFARPCRRRFWRFRTARRQSREDVSRPMCVHRKYAETSRSGFF
jgi:hypothetical protein